ncbi:hypothetical protein [Adonisia turfae]|uniref:Prenyltransferase n=1 Tax=Adonisia turfae CCMR0081 TaxID=2292702 RepID=A0A6M0RMW8_9CYAN|nr:hypothetical protein [Adonisia turfae]NEZ57092.1 hypothetical protein [Adonisia turfae CCMR0081]
MIQPILTRTALEASQQFIEQKGRPLEIARFHHAFNGASADSVVAALKEFQNPDGGFGHGLEPDLRTNDSSALCTSIAFQVFRSINGTSDHEVVSVAIAYLLKTLDQKEWHWPIIPKSAQQSPHAPWWEQSDDEETSELFSLNPTAEILGYLYDYQHLVPETIISQVSERVMGALSNTEQMGMHDLLCCLRLMKTKTLPDEFREQIRQAVAQQIDGTIEKNSAAWEGYCLRPLQVIDAPDSPFMAGMEEAVTANLAYEISTQSEEGAWSPTWSWGDMFPDAWQQAHQDWSGVITVETLLVLKRFGCLEGVS